MPYHGKILVGLTGNIACGKSTVLRRMRELGATTIDADRMVHAILRKGGPAYAPVVAEFGESILDKDDEIDRRALGKVVFSDPAKLLTLEEIEHPIVRNLIEEEINNAPERIVALDAIKLIESGWADRCDAVWVVTCTGDQQIERLMRTRHFSREDAELRVNAQSPQQDKVARADVVIDNSGSLELTFRQATDAFAALLSKFPLKSGPKSGEAR